MKKQHFNYDMTYALLQMLLNSRTVEIDWENSDPNLEILFTIEPYGTTGKIKIMQSKEAEIYIEDVFVTSINKFEWEVFKPYLETLPYEHFLRLGVLSDFVKRNSKKISSKYMEHFVNLNKLFLRDILEHVKFLEKDEDYSYETFTFKLCPFGLKNQFLCEVSYNETLHNMITKLKPIRKNGNWPNDYVVICYGMFITLNHFLNMS